MPSGNPGATYFGEAAYISPHEYTWCQSHPDECNMFNNFSYRQFSVTGGPTFFNFSASEFDCPHATCYPGLGSYGRHSTAGRA